MRRIRSFLQIAVFSTINILLFLNMAKIYEVGFANNSIRLVCYVLLPIWAIAAMLCEIVSSGGKVKLSSFGCATFCYSIILLVLLCAHKTTDADVFLNCFMVLFAMLASYYAFKRVEEAEKFLSAQCVIAVILWILYIYSRFNISQSGAPVINSVYYVVLLFPFVLCAKQQTFRGILITLVTLAALVSLKRTAALLIIACLLIYFATKNKNDRKKLVALFGGTALVFVIIVVLQTRYHIDIIGRFRETAEDGGSGRVDIYGKLLKGLPKRSVWELLFGGGYYAVIDIREGSAHNDFLEIIYDFGLIGFMAYMAIWRKLFVAYRGMRKVEYPYRLQFFLSLVCWFFMSMFSHVIMVPTYVMFLALFWGIILGDYRKKTQITR